MGVPAHDVSRSATPVAMGLSIRNHDEDDQMDDGAQDAQDTEVGHIGSLGPEFDFVSEMLLASVASSGRKFGRATRAAHRRIVS